MQVPTNLNASQNHPSQCVKLFDPIRRFSLHTFQPLKRSKQCSRKSTKPTKMYLVPACIRDHIFVTFILTLTFTHLSSFLILLADNLGAVDLDRIRDPVTGKHRGALVICMWAYFGLASAALILAALTRWVWESHKRDAWFLKKSRTGRLHATRENIVRSLETGENVGVGRIVDVEMQSLGGRGYSG